MLYFFSDSPELHLYEGYISYSTSGSIQDWLNSWGERFFQFADKNISEGWKASAHVLLNQVFHKWEPSNHESIKTLIQHLNNYKKGFHLSNDQWLTFPGNLTPSQINVNVCVFLYLCLFKYCLVHYNDCSCWFRSQS